MPKTWLLTTTVILAFGVAPVLAQSPRRTTQPRDASQTGDPAAATIASPTVGVVVDPQAKTAIIVPVNPRADVPADVTVALKALSATGRVEPGQIVQIVVQRGDRVTQVITNAPIP
ncbi:MAG: hypothetical protein ACXWKM_14035 [Phenylobacterium sp.]